MILIKSFPCPSYYCVYDNIVTFSGLASLRQNAEEDYSTLLHLERVLNMRDGGDFVPTLDTPIIQHNRAYLNSPLGFAGAGSSGDHLTSNIGSRLKKVERNLKTTAQYIQIIPCKSLR